ncbi:2-phosphoglycerate kinase [Oceanobacillus piezotolerans]|uniref:2-phosphoglycerate kinase n=1 Tax=Oceanobacillus piezotolerans TaxID=2448030 RepID=A0A498DAR1_9BACI|nr:2-phosphoglycerate kinase [Oceanobacillus piezotolerans]RLL48433.1 2-phosphoglycerate kinase [Oceanobacillus piezotolerans]
MVILISAVSGTGKTLMAQKLLEKYHISFLSVDHLKMGLYRGDKNCGFTPLDGTEVIGDHLWPILKGIIMTNIENEQHIIIEGSYILPHYLKDFDINYSEKIIPVFLGFSTDYIQENFETKIVKYRNAVELRSWPEERTIEELIKEHKIFKTKCLQAGVKYFEIDNDYDKEILNVYNFIEAEKQRIAPL